MALKSSARFKLDPTAHENYIPPYYAEATDGTLTVPAGSIVKVTKHHWDDDLRPPTLTGIDVDASQVRMINPEVFTPLTLDRAVTLIANHERRIKELEMQIENAATALGYNDR